MKYAHLYVRPCGPEDLEAVLSLQDDVFRVLPDNSLLRRNTPELLAPCLAAPNLTVGVFAGTELVAVGILVDPRPPETDLRAGLVKYAVKKAMDMKLILVHPAHRGLGLQRAVMWICEKMASLRGCTHLCTSVSPDNLFSLRNIAAMGYLLDHAEELYGGLLRNVCVKTISFSAQAVTEGLCRIAPDSPAAPDLSSCIPGDVRLACPGDAAEYIRTDTGVSVFGPVIASSVPRVLLPGKTGAWNSCPLMPEVSGSLILKTVWINTTDHSLFFLPEKGGNPNA